MNKKYLSGVEDNNSAMHTKKGQVALEYLSVTIFILVAVTIIFAFAYVNYDQAIKIAKTNDALTTMVSAADEVYSLGRGNTRFIEVSFPSGMTGLDVKHACCRDSPTCATLEAVDSEADCEGANEEVKFSMIEITLNLLGASSAALRESKAVISENASDFPTVGEAIGGAPFTMKVGWTATGKIELRKV